MNNHSSLGIIFAAGGSSRRFGGGSKLFAELNGKPVFIHSLQAMITPETPAVLVISREAEADFREELARWGLEHVAVVIGGASRSESVFNGLQALCALSSPPEYIAVHDAARPLADRELLLSCLRAAEAGCDGAIAARKVTDTSHRTDEAGILESTPPREALWAAETPQLFTRTILCRAFSELPWRENPPTDEAALAAALPGTRIRMVENSRPNPKITFQSDLSALRGII